MPQTVYCDESGYSGNNLLDPGQPFFTYSSVAIDEIEAADMVRRVISDFQLDAVELKGARLARSNRGRKAMSAILTKFADRALVSAWHKRYCLATKFFEYVFEPVLAEQNAIFYRTGFHRFISNVLYFESLKNDRRATVALEVFQALARAQDETAVARLFPLKIVEPSYSEVVSEIEAFVAANHDAIAREVSSFRYEDPVYRWLLDLSVSALFALLTTWGQRFDALVVICDESKPLYESREPFDMMIGRTDKREMVFEGKKQSLIFNLSEPIKFTSSTASPGIQVADIFASALSFALRNPREPVSQRWMGILSDSISEFSVFPDEERVDLASEQGFVNRALLQELVRRSQRGASVFAGMPKLIAEKHTRWRSQNTLIDAFTI